VEAKYDLVVCLLISVLVTVRAILEYTWICQHDTWVCVMLLVVVAVAQCGYLILGAIVYQNMGRRFYKKARSADARIHKAYFKYQRFSAVLKLDFVLILLLIFTGMYYAAEEDVLAARALSGLFLVTELFWEAIGFYYARKENTQAHRIFRLIGLVVPTVYLAVVGYLFSRANGTHDIGYDSAFAKFITLAACALVNRAMVVYASQRLLFGTGLKEHYFDKGQQ